MTMKKTNYVIFGTCSPQEFPASWEPRASSSESIHIIMLIQFMKHVFFLATSNNAFLSSPTSCSLLKTASTHISTTPHYNIIYIYIIKFVLISRIWIWPRKKQIMWFLAHAVPKNSQLPGNPEPVHLRASMWLCWCNSQNVSSSQQPPMMCPHHLPHCAHCWR